MSTQRALPTRSLTVAGNHLRSAPAPKNPALRLQFGSVILSTISGRQYLVGEVLGSGGFGAVYRVTQVTGGAPLPGTCVEFESPIGWHFAVSGEQFGCRCESGRHAEFAPKPRSTGPSTWYVASAGIQQRDRWVDAGIVTISVAVN